jgi:hypothetical protein
VPPASAWQACGAALLGARGVAERAGSGFAVALAESPDPASREATEIVARELRQSDVVVWRLDELLGGADPALRYPRDRHWNALGHERVAAALEEPVRALLRARAGDDTTRPGPAAPR